MVGTNNTLQWEAPKFSFSTASYAEEWKAFYIRALNYLETLHIGKHRQALETCLPNGIITPEMQQKSKLILTAIQTAIKEAEHFWHYHDDLVLDLCQQPDKPIHSLSTCFIQLINK